MFRRYQVEFRVAAAVSVVHAVDAALHVEHASFDGSAAADPEPMASHGGAIRLCGARASLSARHVVFWRCGATHSGGAIAVLAWPGACGSSSDGGSDGGGGSGGGAVPVGLFEVLFAHSSLSKARGDVGGALFAVGDAQLRLNRTVFAFNRCPMGHCGGALYLARPSSRNRLADGLVCSIRGSTAGLLFLPLSLKLVLTPRSREG